MAVRGGPAEPTAAEASESATASDEASAPEEE